MARLDVFHPNIKFTWESSRSFVNFLDVVAGTEGKNFVTDVYYKPTDCHQFLHYESSHHIHIHIQRSIFYSQSLRIKRICSTYDLFLGHLEKLREWFIKRGYPTEMVDSQLDKVRRSTRVERSNSSKTSDSVPLVVTYHPQLASFGAVLRQKLYLLYANEEVEKCFTSLPFMAFRTARNLGNFLVRATVYPMEREKDSCKMW